MSDPAAHRLRTYTVAPVIGVIKEAPEFRQFSLRGFVAAHSDFFSDKLLGLIHCQGGGGLVL